MGILTRIFRNRVMDDDYDIPEDFEYTEDYFMNNLDEMPECCQACGGPYPNCTDSCKIFDD